MNDWDVSLSRAVVPIDALAPGGADIVVLGELNHFVHHNALANFWIATLAMANQFRRN